MKSTEPAANPNPFGQGGRLKALRLEGYANRARKRPEALQQVLFPYLDAL